jgi:hypothetical protein
MIATTLLENRLGLLLGRGTWIACAVICIGIGVRLFHNDMTGDRIVNIGVAIIIALPVLRVATMLEFFYRNGQIRFSMICALVLLIVAASVLVGLAMRI